MTTEGMTTAPAAVPRPPGFAAQAARALKALPTLLRVGISEVVAYRAEFVVWILTTNMPLVMLALWHAVAADGPVGRFDQKGFTAYYLGVLAVRLLTTSWVVWQLSMEVRDGTLAAKLLRPIHPIVSLAADHVSAVPMRALVISPVVAILVAVAGDRLLRHDPVLVAVFGASLAGAWLLIFFTMVLMGSLAFFVDSALGIFELWLGVHAILSGYLVPLELLPRWVARIARLSPFDSMLAFPLETLTGKRDLGAALASLGVQWLYVAVMAAAGLTVWRRGVRRYVAFGG